MHLVEEVEVVVVVVAVAFRYVNIYLYEIRVESKHLLLMGFVYIL